jgi:hypothetical protein
VKTLLALLIAYTATQVAYDRVYQHRALDNQSPEIKICQFKPLLNYGITLKIRGYFENGSCLKHF